LKENAITCNDLSQIMTSTGQNTEQIILKNKEMEKRIHDTFYLMTT
jgi:hypothetical protein